MSEVERDIPEPEARTLRFALDERRVTFTVEEDLYPRDAIYGAAYLFVNRCYVFLDKPADAQVSIQLRAKGEADEAAL